jgi:hypothetical protein
MIYSTSKTNLNTLITVVIEMINMNRFNSEASILFVDDRRLPRANKT